MHSNRQKSSISSIAHWLCNSMYTVQWWQVYSGNSCLLTKVMAKKESTKVSCSFHQPLLEPNWSLILNMRTISLNPRGMSPKPRPGVHVILSLVLLIYRVHKALCRFTLLHIHVWWIHENATYHCLLIFGVKKMHALSQWPKLVTWTISHNN